MKPNKRTTIPKIELLMGTPTPEEQKDLLCSIAGFYSWDKYCKSVVERARALQKARAAE